MRAATKYEANIEQFVSVEITRIDCSSVLKLNGRKLPSLDIGKRPVNPYLPL